MRRPPFSDVIWCEHSLNQKEVTVNHSENIKNEDKENRTHITQRARRKSWLLALLMFAGTLVQQTQAASAIELSPIGSWALKSIAGYLMGQAMNAIGDAINAKLPMEESKLTLEPTKHYAHLEVTYKGMRRVFHKEYFNGASPKFQYAVWSESDGVLDAPVSYEPFEIDPGRKQTSCSLTGGPGQPGIWSARGSVETQLRIIHKVTKDGRFPGPANPRCVVNLKGARYDYCEARVGVYEQHDARIGSRNGSVPYSIPEQQVEVTSYSVDPSS